MSPRRLLIRLGSLGDVVLATAAANAAREVWGKGCLDVLVKEEWGSLWENHPAVDRVWSWPRGERDLQGFRSWRSRLARVGYAETFDLQVSLRTRLLTRSGMGRVRRPRRNRFRRRLLVAFKRWGPPRDFHVARSFVETVVPGGEALPSLHPGDAARERARALLPGNRERIGLVPGARHATKRWPLERFVETGRCIADSGPVPVFFGEDETDLLEECRRFWPEGKEWFPVREDLPTTAACLGRLRAVVTNDTGLMHMAAAMETPVVALFGPTVRSFGFAPLGDRHRVLEVPELACRPCSLHGGERCPKGHFHCMLETDPVRVTQALAGLDAESMIDPAATA